MNILMNTNKKASSSEIKSRCLIARTERHSQQRKFDRQSAIDIKKLLDIFEKTKKIALVELINLVRKTSK